VKPEQERIVSKASESLGLSLSSSQVGLLLQYGELLRARAVPLGLIGERDEDRILVRHVLDSLRAAGAVETSEQLACDLGSGAGLPAIPVAVAHPIMTVLAVESRRTRAAFQEFVLAELGLTNLEVHWGRAEELSGPFDVCFARAFAPLERSWQVAEPLLGPGGRLIYFAGRSETRLPELPGASSAELRQVPLLDSPGALAIIKRQ
jgi:16S rRNA (guanine527-N7)-methyltransferase